MGDGGHAVSEAFRPIGERARWRMVYDLMRQAKLGDTVTYADMAKALGLNAKRDKHALQMAARRAGLELEKADHRAADAVRGVGYRIVQPAEILGLGQRRNRRAGRQLQRGAITVAAVDLDQVDVPTRQALETLARGFAVQGEINRRFLAKQAKQDDLINMLIGRVEKLERDK